MSIGSTIKEGCFCHWPGGTGITDLNSLVDLPEGVILATATGINNVGQVVLRSPWSMVPEPSSYALMLAGLALVGMIIQRKELSTIITLRARHPEALYALYRKSQQANGRC